jgi:plasmid stabilization system protein ParE
VDYRLVYTEKAVNDFAEVFRHISDDGPVAASSFGRSLKDHFGLLTRFPHMGGTIRKRMGVRKLVYSPYLIYYRVHEGERLVEVLHIRHGAQTSKIQTVVKMRGWPILSRTLRKRRLPIRLASVPHRVNSNRVVGIVSEAYAVVANTQP